MCECVCADAAKVVAGANKRAFSSLVPGPHRITRHDCRARHVASDLSPVLTARSPQHTATRFVSLAGIWNRTVNLNLNARVFGQFPAEAPLPRVDTRSFGVALGALTGWAGVAHWVDRATGPSWHHGGTCLMQRKTVQCPLIHYFLTCV